MINNLTYNADMLFIEYDDILRSPELAFLKGARTSGKMRELFDFSPIDSLDDVGLTEWYWFRFNKNSLMDLNPSVSEQVADEILRTNLSDPNFYFLYKAALPLHFSSKIPSIISHKIAKKIIVWSPYDNPNIRKSLKESFPDLPVHYMPGNFKDIVKKFSKDSTYILSDIRRVVDLQEIGYLNLSSIVLATYRYNMMRSDMHQLQFDLDQYMKENNIVFKYAYWSPMHTSNGSK